MTFYYPNSEPEDYNDDVVLMWCDISSCSIFQERQSTLLTSRNYSTINVDTFALLISRLYLDVLTLINGAKSSLL